LGPPDPQASAAQSRSGGLLHFGAAWIYSNGVPESRGIPLAHSVLLPTSRGAIGRELAGPALSIAPTNTQQTNMEPCPGAPSSQQTFF